MSKSFYFFLVDDDIDDVSLFADLLSEIDPSIKFQYSLHGVDALEKLRESQTSLPDIIFLDLNMPLMDGKQCLRELKEDESLRDIPVTMFTTSSHSRDIEETLQCGAISFITKPSSIMELKEILLSFNTNLSKDLKSKLRELSENVSTFIVVN